jgi:2-polyprenyl-6-methoxyphenol hydroxylase-like FAD-dependent oxidoreductase
MLARLLHLKGITVTVFESEESPNYRSQGGTLDLHSSTGMVAMKESGLWSEFTEHARYDGQYLAMTDRNLKYLFVRGAKDNITKVMDERPEIDRAKLRQILTESLPDGMIKWGHRLLDVLDDGTLVFQDSRASGFDLVVGAEGAWSKVRKHLNPELTPVFCGVGMHDMHIPDAANIAPDVYKLVNRGSIFAGSEGQRLTCQQLGTGDINIYAFQRRDDADWMKPEKCGYDSSSPKESKPAILKEYESWCPELRAALEAVDGPCIPRSLYTLPVGQHWEHKQGFTLIGDAAHLMTPYAGEGVNQAFEDALCLSRVIATSVADGKDLDADVQQFEVEMWERTTKIAQLSLDLLNDWMFTPGAPESIMPRVLGRHVNAKLPWFMHPLTLAGLHTYYYLASWIRP